MRFVSIFPPTKNRIRCRFLMVKFISAVVPLFHSDSTLFFRSPNFLFLTDYLHRRPQPPWIVGISRRSASSPRPSTGMREAALRTYNGYAQCPPPSCRNFTTRDHQCIVLQWIIVECNRLGNVARVRLSVGMLYIFKCSDSIEFSKSIPPCEGVEGILHQPPRPSDSGRLSGLSSMCDLFYIFSYHRGPVAVNICTIHNTIF